MAEDEPKIRVALPRSLQWFQFFTAQRAESKHLLDFMDRPRHAPRLDALVKRVPECGVPEQP